MSDEDNTTSPVETTGPAAVPNQGTHPAGWASAGHAERAQRDALRTVILIEREEAAFAELEAEIDRRLDVARGVTSTPVAEADRVSVRSIVDGERGEAAK